MNCRVPSVVRLLERRTNFVNLDVVSFCVILIRCLDLLSTCGLSNSCAGRGESLLSDPVGDNSDNTGCRSLLGSVRYLVLLDVVTYDCI